MKIRINRDHILVISEPLVRFIGRTGTGSNEAKGLAFFPFIFVRREEFVLPWLINHERIHHKQQIETLFVGVMLLSVFEMLHARIVLRKDKMQSYLYTSAEQEAYINMHNPDYIQARAPWALFKYVKNKRNFTLTAPGVVSFLD